MAAFALAAHCPSDGTLVTCASDDVDAKEVSGTCPVCKRGMVLAIRNVVPIAGSPGVHRTFEQVPAEVPAVVAEPEVPAPEVTPIDVELANAPATVDESPAIVPPLAPAAPEPATPEQSEEVDGAQAQ